MKTDVARPFLITFFKSKAAPTLTTQTLRLWELRDLILTTTADKKTKLRWLKAAQFGTTPSEENCLRYNDNVLAISGAIGEHDDGAMSFDEAIKRLRAAMVTALVYTSPSNTATSPRWRVVAPMSHDLPPTEHAKQLARINGVLSGVLSPESFTLSQAYYFGKIGNNPDHRCEYTIGEYVDQRADLDEGACGKGGKPYVEGEQHTPGSDPQADAELVAACVAEIPNNDVPQPEYNRIGMAIWRATGGSKEGFKIFDTWARKSKKYGTSKKGNSSTERWRHWFRSPPNQIGFGTLHHLADEASPGWRTAYEDGVLERAFEAIREHASKAKASKPSSKAKKKAKSTPPPRPVIRIVAGEIAKTTDQAEAALAAAAEAAPVMVRAGLLVQLIVDKVPASHGRMTEVTLLRALQPSNVVYLLNKHAATFMRYAVREKEWVAVDPPTALATQLLGKGKWQFPKVSGVITTPTLRPDGSVLDQPGYDPATQLWLSLDSELSLPKMTERPTRAQAEKALKLFEALLKNFPFAEPLDRAVALAAILTAVLRGAFDVAPMFLFVAFEPGSGKSYLVNLISIIARGRVCPVITNVESSEEMEKRLGALVLEGTPMISLDNCSANIGGDLLCQITEQRLIKIRILGRSETPECEWRGVLLGTGNNVTLHGDMTRRGMLSHLDPKVERPELREFSFDPIERVLENRGTYIAAALTIARGYIAAGSPKVCGPLGSYEEWSRMVRSPLIWLGRQDPVKSMDEARETDPANTALRDLIGFWKETLLGKTGFTANALIAHVDQKVKIGDSGFAPEEFKHPEFRDLLLEQAGNERGGIDSQKLGSWLTSVRGQIRDGHRIELVRQSKHGNRYALTKV